MSSYRCWEASPKVNCTGLSPVNITCHGIAKDGKALCGSQEFITKHRGLIYRLSIEERPCEYRHNPYNNVRPRRYRIHQEESIENNCKTYATSLSRTEDQEAQTKE